jgi:hypothetical protein
MDLGIIAVLAGVVLFYGLLAWLFLRVYRRQRGPLRRALFVLLVLFSLDGLVAGQGFFTLLIGILGVVAQLGFAAWRALRRDVQRSLAHLGAAGVYVVTLAVVWGYIAYNNRLAARRASEVIAACRAYEARHGQLPNTLTDLVPTFLPAVPRAKYTLMSADFRYWVSQAESGSRQGKTTGTSPHHALAYVVVPPFGRRLYHFESDSWSYLD